MKILNCYIEMLPVIKAEESLLRYQAMACGVGPKTKRQAHQMKKQVREWVKTMGRYSGRAKQKMGFEGMKAALESMGIRVKTKGEARG